MDWKERKKQRKEYYEHFILGWKQQSCSACSGSGYYDDTNSPKCGVCNGTGKDWYKAKSNNKVK